MITCSGSTGDTLLALLLYFSMPGIFGSLFSALSENLGMFDCMVMKGIGPFLSRTLYFNTQLQHFHYFGYLAYFINFVF